jgi:hypothetical protein
MRKMFKFGNKQLGIMCGDYWWNTSNKFSFKKDKIGWNLIVFNIGLYYCKI